MSIKDFPGKIKTFMKSPQGRDFYIVLVLVFASLSSFGLGRISRGESAGSPGVELVYSRDMAVPQQAAAIHSVSKAPVATTKTTDNSLKQIVASSRGSKYYYTWCSGAKNLSEANKVYFSTETEAEAAGYSKSTSCK